MDKYFDYINELSKKPHFLFDVEKMRDFIRPDMDKEDFLESYSYLTEEEYDNTERLFDYLGGLVYDQIDLYGQKII